MAIALARDFWIAEFKSKIEATIKNVGDMIGWDDDFETVGPIAAAAKSSLLRAIPHILPAENSGRTFYQHVLEHGDFGIHNTSIVMDANEQPLLTSLYDWETGCITPAILSDPSVAVSPVDLITDENGEPAITRVPEDSDADDCALYATWAGHYIEVCQFL